MCRYSVERPVALGLAARDAPLATTRALSQFASATGHAFQLRDDLADLYGSPETSGKTAGCDIRDGKPTELLGTALHLAAGADRHTLESVVGNPEADAAAIDRAKQILADVGVVAAIRQRLDRLVGAARASLRDNATDLAPAAVGGRSRLLGECTDLSFVPAG
jgi:geranylgeranyl diphosphate synthase type I